MSTRILLADSHRMFREGIKEILERHGYQVVAECEDGEQAVSQAFETPIDVAILETQLPRLSGIDAIEQIRKDRKETRCIALSSSHGHHEVELALRMGASGYVVKSSPVRELLDALEVVKSGRSYLSPSVTQHLVDAISDPRGSATESIHALTRREREVLQHIADGQTSKEIAADLGVSIKTIDSHRARLMQKLDIHKASALVRFAIQNGLVSM